MNETLVGHNQPPDMAATAETTAHDLSNFMSENPVIENEDQAREAKVFVDRGALCLKDMEDERKGRVAPFREQVEKINNHYRAPRELLGSMVDELKRRTDSYLLAEERKRVLAAEEAARVAERAAQQAREAEQREQEAIAAADSGELGLDLAGLTVDADKAFSDYKKAERQAAVAEREAKVKIGGGFTRALSLKTKEELVVTDVHTAVKILGAHEYIVEAVLKAARVYRKLHGCLPHGVESIKERRS